MLREISGTRNAERPGMATIFALILLPGIIGVAALLSSSGDSAAMAGAGTFAVLAGSLFYGLLRMSRRWEDEAA